MLNRPRNLASQGAICSMGLVVFALMTCPRAGAAVVCSSPDLPPECGEYRTAQDVHTAFQNPDPAITEVILKDTSHHTFLNPVRTPLAGGDELEEFNSTLSGDVDVTLDLGGGSTLSLTLPFVLTGPVQVVTSGKTGNIVGTFDTEMISMSLTGDVGGFNIHIRESPTLPSLGDVTITDIGGGDFELDSTFEIFTEISVNSGSWVPADSSSIVTLVPEPSAGILSLLGLAGLVARRRR